MDVELAPGLFLIWLIHLAPAAIGCGLIWWIARRRVKWTFWDLSVLAMPYWVWALAFMINGEGKDWGNLWEGIMLGVIVPLAPIGRGILGQRYRQRIVAFISLLVLSLIGLVLWAFVPELSGE